MCLIINGAKKKAKTDIVCYKIMVHYLKGICSRYRDMVWNIGEEHYAGRANAGYIKKYGEVHEGYFHSYKRIPAADVSKGNEFVYECVIPKGAWYYEGIHTDGIDGYASKSLKVVKCLQK